nr:MAG TPA: hypothetical protein [Caudoviricetes sp.]
MGVMGRAGRNTSYRTEKGEEIETKQNGARKED